MTYKLSVTGGSGAPATESLPHDGEIQHDITRAAASKEIRVTVASTKPTGLSDSATSVRPGPGVQEPKPTFIAAQIWSPAIADPPEASKPCEFYVKNKDLNVMAYDASSTGLALMLKGASVLPQPGSYPIAPTTSPDISILANRALDDFAVGGGSEIRLAAPNSAGSLLVRTPVALPGCAHYRLHFSNAHVVITQPPSVYALGNTPISETHEYKRSGDCPNHWGNIGCPNCGEMYACSLTGKLSHPLGRIASVSFLAQSGSTQWYRCYTTTPVCQTNGEVTATLDRQSGSCVGRDSCYSWRFSTDGNEATDTYQLSYREKVCVRYCSR